ncbi:hypothetical protein PCCS19_11940 [Paenibacillus sp. CCS19]|uniref:oligosaccharide flippase family protein n=1 Tax=Paenibacillus sp. CCS19 TaxID=3158387 RepID=UPI00256DBB4D|nr:oligosaccharide flippase family protein [Paenibacillus cellulosilyticus]GMK38140.1 hypothetical protein PCCS19_11940 [Paenibacillus cellulosilyticus]
MLSKGLVRKSGLYFIGNFSSKIMTSLLIPIYAFYINADDLGYFDSNQAMMGILSPIIILAIWEAVLKYILIENDVNIKRKIVTSSALFSFVISIILLLGIALFDAIYDFEVKYFGLVAAMIILNSCVYLWQYYARAFKYNKLFVVSGILSTLVNFIFVIILVVTMKMGLIGLLLSYCAGQVATIITIEIKVRVVRMFKFSDFDIKWVKRMIAFSLPLVLNLTSAWLISGFGRLIITAKLGVYENGLYSFANKFPLVITMIGSVITMAIIEESILSVKSKKRGEDFGRTIESLFKIFQSIAIMAVPAIVVFYYFISKTEYHESLIYVPGLLVYAVANTMASNMGSMFQALDKTKYQFLTTAIGGLVTVVLAVCLIDKIGIPAVIAGQVSGAIAMLMLRYFLVQRFTVFKVKWSPILIMAIVFCTVAMICLNTNVMISVLVEILILGWIIYLNRKFVMLGWETIKSKVMNK